MPDTTRTAVLFSFIDQYSSLVVTLVISMILARLLTPAEVGVFAVTTIFVGIVSSVRDMGAGGYIIRAPVLTEENVRATKSIQLGMGVVLAVLTLVASPWFAAIYDTPEIERIMWVLAANFLIIPFGSIYVAIWTRELKFKKIAIMRFSGTLIGGLVGILMAKAGWGAISLACASIVTQGVGVICALFMWKKQGESINVSPGIAGIKNVFAFGSRLTIYSTINNAIAGTPELLLGRLQSLGQAGLFSRGVGLVSLFDMLIMNAVNAVMFPVFSQTLRSGGDLGATYVRVLTMLTSIGWLCLGALGICAFPVMRILFGSQWDDSVPLVPILCIAAALSLNAKLTGMLLITKGSIRTVLQSAIITSAITIGACFFGARIGMTELAWGLAISAAINSVIWIMKARGEIHFEIEELLKKLFFNAAIAFSSLIPLIVVKKYVGFLGGIGDLVILIPLAALTLLIYYLLIRSTEHPIYVELESIFPYFKRRV